MRKYRVVVNPKEDTPENIFHLFAQDTPAVPVEFVEGEKGCFVYKNAFDKETPWHRMYTSLVKSVVETEDSIVVETENSIYTFAVVEDE